MNQIDLQQQIIELTLKSLNEFKSIEGVFLVGSHAINQNTLFSDVDLCILFKSDEREGLKQIHQLISNLLPTLSTLYLFDKEGLYLFENGVRLDVSYIKPSDFKDWKLNKCKILQDDSGVIAKQVEATKNTVEPAPQPIWNPAEGEFIDWFFWMFRQIYCWTKQSELNPEKRFDKLYSSQSSLASVRDKLLKMRLYVNGSRDYLNNIDKDLAHRLSGTFVEMNSKSILNATRELFDIYVYVGRDYCKKINTKFPEDKVIKMKELFNLFDSI